jgi:hypothetical protein
MGLHALRASGLHRPWRQWWHLAPNRTVPRTTEGRDLQQTGRVAAFFSYVFRRQDEVVKVNLTVALNPPPPANAAKYVEALPVK